MNNNNKIKQQIQFESPCVQMFAAKTKWKTIIARLFELRSLSFFHLRISPMEIRL